MNDVIQHSINTGVVHVLSQLGGGKINVAARTKLHTYFTERFGMGSLTGIEQPYESGGVVFGPNEGDGLNVRYANMTFGQGMTSTMVQVASAMASLVNGGTYYKPYLVYSQTDETGREVLTDPVVVRSNVIKKSTSDDIKAMLKLAVDGGGGRSAQKAGYKIGGKTGTAQVALPDGTYSNSLEIGSFAGYIEGADGVEYVIMTRVDEPQVYLYAGSGAAAPLFADIAHWIIDYERIPPIE
jgi:cell division protein FtsI/penicillin-binding protein 2